MSSAMSKITTPMTKIQGGVEVFPPSQTTSPPEKETTSPPEKPTRTPEISSASTMAHWTKETATKER